MMMTEERKEQGPLNAFDCVHHFAVPCWSQDASFRLQSVSSTRARRIGFTPAALLYSVMLARR